MTTTPTPLTWQHIADDDPVAQCTILTSHWERTGTFTASGATRMGILAARWGSWLTHRHVRSLVDATGEDCAAFLVAATRRNTPPAPSTMHLRRSALRAIYRTIAELDGPDLTIADRLDLPAKATRDARAITDEELDLLRVAAHLHRGRRLNATAAVALGEATATTGEITVLDWDHVDLDTGCVALPGIGGLQPRHLPLTDWARTVLANHPDRVGRVINQNPTSTTISQAEVTTLIRRLFDRAGLADAGLKPGSIRLWRPTRMLAAGGRIETAAYQLGITSLDATARLLDWKPDPATWNEP